MKKYLFLAKLIEFGNFLQDFGEQEFYADYWSIRGDEVIFVVGGAEDIIPLSRAVEEYEEALKNGWGGE